MIVPEDLRLRLATATLVLLLLTPVAGIGPAVAAVAGVLALGFATGRLPHWRRLLHVEGFLLVVLGTVPFALPGTPLFRFGPLTATLEGFDRAVVIAAKLTASVLVLVVLFAGTDPLRLGVALRVARLPEPLVRLFLAMARHLAILRAELARLHDAMRARAFRPRSDRHTWRSYGYLFATVLVRALDRADRVEEAMRVRGYDGRFPSGRLPPPASADWAAAALLVGAAAMLLLWDRTWTS